MAGEDEVSTTRVLATTIAENWRKLLLWGVAVAILFQVVMFSALILRFQALPNYVTFYDWPGNVLTIIRSTPSWADIPPIIADEWLIEVGRMNYDYGTGISEWSLNVVPSRMAVLFVLGILIGMATILMRSESCDRTTVRSSAAATGLGAGLVAMTNVTMSWVVCCATPNWVVGLAMMGLGVSTSLALERLGTSIGLVGFSVLVAMIVFLAWRRAHPSEKKIGEALHA
jgi:hypothetical protein